MFFANLLDSLLEPVSKIDSIGISCEETKSEKHRGRMLFEFYTTSYGWEQQLYLSACSFIRVATMHSVPKSFAEIYTILAFKPGVIIRIAKLSSNTFWGGLLSFRNPKTKKKGKLCKKVDTD